MAVPSPATSHRRLTRNHTEWRESCSPPTPANPAKAPNPRSAGCGPPSWPPPDTKSGSSPAPPTAPPSRPAPSPPPTVLHFVYFDLPDWLRRWKRGNRGVHWYYALWQWGAYRIARRLTRRIRFDRVHHVTFVGLRAPSFMGLLGLPFVLGPVSGGECVPRPLRRGMSRSARLREWMRDLANRATRLDPLMSHTFRNAERILLATPESRALVPQAFHAKCEVQLGVGLSREYLGWIGPRTQPHTPALRLLYAGRLLEWKGVDLALLAVQRRPRSRRRRPFHYRRQRPRRTGIAPASFRTCLTKRRPLA